MITYMKSRHLSDSRKVGAFLKAAISVLAVGMRVLAAPGAPVSDEFNSTVLNTSLWTFTNPAGGTFSLNGINLLLSVPGGATHDPTASGSDNAVRMMQTIANVDFDVIAKFDSIPTAQYTNEGVIVEQNGSNFLRFELYSDGSQTSLYAATIVAGAETARLNNVVAAGAASFWLRVKRVGNTWTESWSKDGVTYTTGVTFTQALTAARIGPFGANYFEPASSTPAFTASVDYFRNAGGPDLTLTKTHTGNFTPGGTGSYTITVKNTGSAATTGTVTMTDTVPTGLTATTLSGTGWTCALTPTVNCTRSDALPANASYPAITLAVSVAGNAPATVTNTATVAGGGETNTANDSASDPTTISAAGVPDITITKTHSGNFTPGGTGTYTITVNNVGPAATTGTVTMTDTVPTGLTATALSGTGWTCALTPTVNCTRSNALAGGTSYPAITLTVSVASNAPATVTNTATVAGGGETNTANDTATDPTTTNATGPALQLTKTHSGNFTQGGTGSYTITARNVGTAATTGALTMTDTLPNGLTATAVSGSGWTCALTPTVNCTRSDTLASGVSHPAITLAASVANNAPSSVTNSATLSGGGAPTNATASDPTTVTGAGPAITSVAVNPSNTTAVVTWTTDKPSTSRVDDGTTTGYGQTVTQATLVTSHRLSLTGLQCAQLYDFKVTSTDANGNTASSPNGTFTTSSCPAGGPISDSFDAPTINTSLWTAFNPLGDGFVTSNGNNAVITVPAHTSHDPAAGGADNSLRIMQNISNVDFGIEVKFVSAVMWAYQQQGIIVEQDGTNFLRFQIYHDGNTPRLYASSIIAGQETPQVDTPIPVNPTVWLRVTRAGNTWTNTWSLDGNTFTTGIVFSQALTTNRIGPFAANYVGPSSDTPAFTASVDYFFNSSSPLPNQTGPLPFDRIVIDPVPGGTVVEKAMADLDGDGRPDAIIGITDPQNIGIHWYENPHSGVLTDPWLKHTIVASGNAYEDMLAFDVNGDGAIDVIASIDGQIKWFENPRGSGGNAATNPWPVHTIGAGGPGENNMVLADLDGDGKMDIATEDFVYFQNSPTSWTRVQYNNANRGVALLDLGSGNGSINLLSTGPAPYNAVWFENPREHGGNPRTDPWVMHTIGPTYTCGSNNCPDGPYVAVYGAADLNGDGRMDVVVSQSEGVTSPPPPPGGLIWYEAPADRRNGQWIKHTIDSTFQDAHNVRIADINGDGTLDLVEAEQEQSPQRRVSVFYNDGRGNFTQQVLSNTSGHNPVVIDMGGDGDLDILNSPHGFFAAPNPLEIYVNKRVPGPR